MNIWLASDEIHEKVKEVVLKYHNDLVIVSDEIAVLFREKAAKSGGEVLLGRTKKAPQIANILGGTEWKFIIELAADEWVKLKDSQQLALLDHHLCACGVDEDEKDGTIKCFVKSPDYMAFHDNVKRYGHWRYNKDEDEGVENSVEAMFGTGNGDDSTQAQA